MGRHNGLVCAGYLAKAGLDVIVVERSNRIGGACVTEELKPGYVFRICAAYGDVDKFDGKPSMHGFVMFYDRFLNINQDPRYFGRIKIVE